MRFFYLVLCLVQFEVQATDWLNRTVRVDLVTNRNDFKSQFDLFEQSARMESATDATNGQHPWTFMTTAWSFTGGFGIGTACSCTIISKNFALSNLWCVRWNIRPPVTTIEVYIGSVQWNSTRTPTNFVRHYWYIEPTSEERHSIVLFRLHESLTFNPNVQPIRLPSHGTFSYEAWSSKLLGFRTPGSGPFSARLSSADIRILTEGCDFHGGNVPDFEFCGIEPIEPNGSGPITRFNAFSGGAWIVYQYSATGFHPVQVGIHQYQFVNQSASFAYGTKVAPFVEWIETLSVE